MAFMSMFSKRKWIKEPQNNQSKRREPSLLDLPDLPLEDILSRLPPACLVRVGAVCKELRSKSRSDYLWAALVAERWSDLARTEDYCKWKREACRKIDCGFTSTWKCRFTTAWIVKLLLAVWPFSGWKGSLHERQVKVCHPPLDNLMAWYWALERGKAWFPAQVYNREHGHVGFTLSCYDAEVCYNRDTNTFSARYLPHGPRTVVIEEGVPWDRLRAPPVKTPAHSLHTSENLDELRPGDHVEVQWRRNREFPYGWWYAVVGHNDKCDRSDLLCRCHLEGVIYLEFNQYTYWSRWRRAILSRKCHGEIGNEVEGFYGGIRKLTKKEEIFTWQQLWPVEKLD